MKVIHFVTAIDRSLGGVSTYMQLLAKELGKLVELIVVTRPTEHPLRLENCRIIYLPLPLSEIHQFKTQWSLILDNEKPNIVHINGIWMIHTWVIQKEALKRGIQTYITTHGMLEPWILNRNPLKKKIALWLFQRKSLKKAIALIATAESEKNNILKFGFNKNVLTIPNGIDTSSITIKENWKPTKRIVYLSRIHIKKGIELLLEALSSLDKELKGYEVIIAGEGETTYVDELKKRATTITNMKINFVGGIYGNEKWKLYRECDFFVLPTYSENFGYVIAESLACGTPVITTKNTPWQDIETYNCGYWIKRDIHILKTAIKQMATCTEKELQCMGKQGRKLIENKYSTTIVAKSLLKLYL